MSMSTHHHHRLLAAAARVLQVGAMVAVASVLVGGCSSSEDDTAEASTDPSSTAPAESTTTDMPSDSVTLTVAFDGNTCSYDGPTELSPGEVTLTLVNDSTKTTFAEIAKLQDGVTFDDVIAFHAPEPFEGTRPNDELYEPEVIEQAQAWAGDQGSISGALETGEYVLVCLQRGSANALVWVARPSGVSVTE